MKALTLGLIATTVLITLIAACSRTPMEPTSTMGMDHSMESMKSNGSMGDSMETHHDSMLMDKSMMEKPADQR